MSTKATIIIALLFVILAVVINIYLYPILPDQLASHWNTQNQADGYMSKFWALFLMPIITMVMLVLFLAIPKIDPLKNNIQKFRRYFNEFFALLILFLFYIYGLTITWHLGIKFNMSQALVPALGILFFYIGVLLKYVKRNWFIGIRTPWTLSSDKVWEKTHNLGGKLFKISGIIAILGILFPNELIYIAIAPIFLSSVYTIIYSYLEHKKLKINEPSN